MGYPTHLSAGEVEEFGRELDAIRNEVMDSRGARDRQYILRVIRFQRLTALAGRMVMMLSLLASPWSQLPWADMTLFLVVMGTGAFMLGLAKIIENMEIGHNVMHAQWDWMRDPNIQSNTWEWDNVCPSDQWKHSHNVVHHTWTNVLGKDPDVGYGVLRVTDAQRWHRRYFWNPVVNFVLMLLFQWGVAVHDLHLGRLISGKTSLDEMRPKLKQSVSKALYQLRKDYLLWPLLGAVISLPVSLALELDAGSIALSAFFSLVLANVVANVTRNIWTNIIIFCGHFPAGVHHFKVKDIEGETRAQWYMRQLMGSCNIEGGRLFHILSGNLSHQIEHHLFPDMPSNRYPEIAPRVRALAERYGLHYNSGSFRKQLGSTTWNIWKLGFVKNTANT